MTFCLIDIKCKAKARNGFSDATKEVLKGGIFNLLDKSLD